MVLSLQLVKFLLSEQFEELGLDGDLVILVPLYVLSVLILLRNGIVGLAVFLNEVISQILKLILFGIHLSLSLLCLFKFFRSRRGTLVTSKHLLDLVSLPRPGRVGNLPHFLGTISTVKRSCRVPHIGHVNVDWFRLDENLTFVLISVAPASSLGTLVEHKFNK